MKEGWVEVNVCNYEQSYTINQPTQRQVWQIQDGYERDAVQRDFLKLYYKP